MGEGRALHLTICKVLVEANSWINTKALRGVKFIQHNI